MASSIHAHADENVVGPPAAAHIRAQVRGAGGLALAGVRRSRVQGEGLGIVPVAQAAIQGEVAGREGEQRASAAAEGEQGDGGKLVGEVGQGGRSPEKSGFVATAAVIICQSQIEAEGLAGREQAAQISRRNLHLQLVALADDSYIADRGRGRC